MTLEEFVIMMIHSFILSYFIYHMATHEKKKKLTLIIMVTVFSLNKLLCYYSIPSVQYKFYSQLLLYILMFVFVSKTFTLDYIFYSLMISLIDICSYLLTNFIHTYIQFTPATLYYVVPEIIFLLLLILFQKKIEENVSQLHYHRYLFMLSLIIILIIFYQLNEYVLVSQGSYIFILFIIFTGLYIFLYLDLLQTQKKELEQTLINNELQTKEKNYYQLEHSIHHLSRIRHDMVYVLSHIKHLNHDNEMINQFIDEQLNHIHNNNRTILTGNKTLDSILSEYMNIIKDNHIDLVCIIFEEKSPMSQIDYYTVMSILVEDIVTHVKEGQVSLKHGIQEGYYFVKFITPSLFDLSEQHKKTIQKILNKYDSHLLIVDHTSSKEYSFLIANKD